MNTEMKQALYGADQIAQYDIQAKRLLGQKIILAHILTRVIDEFKNLTPEELVECMDEPMIGSVPVDPGLTNAELVKSEKGDRIIGFNTEHSEINEGTVHFDILTYVRRPDGIRKIIIGLEAQKDEPSRYPILNRGIFYGCRMISSQKERDFSGQQYGEIKAVYSIWVCFNMKEPIHNHIHLTDEKILGNYTWKGDLDLLNVVMIGVPNQLPPESEELELHRLLTALFSNILSMGEKERILREEYHIPMERALGEEAASMCNLGEGIWERGLAKGRSEGIDIGRSEGIDIGRSEMLMNLLGDLGEVPAWIFDKISSLDKDALIQWTKLAARADSMEAFLKEITKQ